MDLKHTTIAATAVDRNKTSIVSDDNINGPVAVWYDNVMANTAPK